MNAIPLRNEKGQWNKGCTRPIELRGMLGKHHSQEWKRRNSLAQKGHLVSNETRRKISIANKGKHSGRHVSEELKLQIANSMKSYWKSHPEQVREIADKRRGKPRSEETIRKVSEGLKNHYKNHGSHPMKGKPEFKEKMKEIMNRPEVKKKVIEATKTYRFNHPEFSDRMSQRTKALWLEATYREKCSEASRKRWLDPGLRQIMTLASKKRWLSPSYRLRFRAKIRERMKDDAYAKRLMKSLHLKPNKQERFLNSILDSLRPNEWKYVGDGELIIDGLCPDFANVNGRKALIEVFGTYWHGFKRTRLTKEEAERQRIEHFAKYGYSTLIVWENELQRENLAALREKLLNFVNGGS